MFWCTLFVSVVRFWFLFSECCSQCVVCRSLFVVRCLVLVVRCSLSVVVVCCLFFVVC